MHQNETHSLLPTSTFRRISGSTSSPARSRGGLRFAAALAALVVLAGLGWCPAAAFGDEPVLGGFDPVALTTGEETPGAARFALEHDGWRYRFASAESRDRFLSDPARYGIQGDGQCPVYPSAEADPAIWTVHEGRIYVFATEACVEKFRQDPEYFIAANVAPDSERARSLQRPARKVAILLYDGVELLDFAGPGEVFAAGGDSFDVYTVASVGGSITSQGFVEVTPEHTFASAPRPDVLVVPGGRTTPLLNDQAALAWIAGAAEDAELVLSVCNGALVLARAGLLDGLEATTHHGSLDALERMAPETAVLRDRRWVDNGQVITAAGVSSGIDAALHAVEKLIGPHTAAGIAGYMEYRWQRDAIGTSETVRSAAAGE